MSLKTLSLKTDDINIGRLMRRWPRVVPGFLSFALVVILFACMPTGKPSSTNAGPSTFRIGYQVIPNSAVLTKSLGLLESKFPDVNIKWIPFPSGWRVNVAMAENKIDVGVVGSVPVSTGIAQGLPFQVYFIYDVIDDSAALTVTKASGIASMADLLGKTIGVPFGSTSHFSLLSALSQAGIDPSDVKILDMQPNDLVAAWKRGAIDGGFVWQPTLSKLLEADGKVIVTAGQLAEKGAMTADLATVSEAFSSAYPGFLAGYVEAVAKATQLYLDDPRTAANRIAEDVGLSPEESLAVMNDLIWVDIEQQPLPEYMGTPEAPGAMGQVLKDSADFMAQQRAIPPAPEVETFEQALYHFAVNESLPE